VFVDVQDQRACSVVSGDPLDLGQCPCANACPMVLRQQVEFVQFHSLGGVGTKRGKADHCVIAFDRQPDHTLVINLIQNHRPGVAPFQHVIDLFGRDDAGIVGVPDPVGQGDEGIDVVCGQCADADLVHVGPFC